MTFFKDKEYFKTIFVLALPIIIQNIVSSSLNMVDVIMIGSFGEKEVAAVGLANQPYFLLMVIIYGVYSGASIFIAQFFGKNDIVNVRKSNVVGLFIGILLSFVFTIVCLIFPEFIMNIFSDDVEVIKIGSSYMFIISLTYMLFSINYSFAFFLRSIKKPNIPMYTGIIALLANTLLNYLLIFGKFGFPKLGIEGAAIATVISRIIELSIMLVYFYKKQKIYLPSIADLKKGLNKSFLVNYLKTIIPVILNESLWALGITITMIAYSYSGTDSVAVVQIARTIENLFFVFIFGLGSACAVVVGNKIGEGDIHGAYFYAKKSIKIALMFGVLSGIVLYLTTPLILTLFNIKPETYQTAITLIKIIAIVISFRFLNFMLIIASFRAGGDTIFSAVIDVLFLWTIGIPLAFAGTVWWDLPIYIVVALVGIEEIFKSFFGFLRFTSKKWIINLTN